MWVRDQGIPDHRGSRTIEEPGHNGTGIFMSVADINGDGRPDIVVAGKEGLTLFKNLGPESAGAK